MGSPSKEQLDAPPRDGEHCRLTVLPSLPSRQGKAFQPEEQMHTLEIPKSSHCDRVALGYEES